MNRSAWMVVLVVAGCTSAQTEPMESVETAEVVKVTDPVESAEPAEVGEPVEPVEPVEAAPSVETPQPAAAGEPMEAVEAGEQLEPLELGELTDLIELVEPVKVEVEGMKIARRAGDLLFGSQPTEAGFDALADQGYLAILTTRGKGELEWDEQALVEDLGLEFYWIPMGKPVTDITDDMVEEFDAFMGNASRPAVLHCASGNRVTGLWAVWMVERKDVDPQVAMGLAKKAGLTKALPLVEKRLGVKALAE